jgi:hypothetical protein
MHHYSMADVTPSPEDCAVIDSPFSLAFLVMLGGELPTADDGGKGFRSRRTNVIRHSSASSVVVCVAS